MESLATFLDRVADRYTKRPALQSKFRFRAEVWSYTQLRLEADRVAQRLRDLGIGKGDRIILWAPNGPWWVAAFFGAMKLGAVVVPLDVRSSPDFVRRVATQSEPKLAVLSHMTAGAWEHDVPSELLEHFESCPPARERVRVDVAPDDLAEIIFTSGTTGDPKGVMLTHGNITSNMTAANQVIPDLPAYRFLSILPLSHMFEQTCGLLGPLLRGASIFYPASRQSTVLFRAFREQAITSVLAVPQALQLFMDAIDREVRNSGREAIWNRMLRIAEHLPMSGRRVLFRSLHQRLGGHFRFFVAGGAPLDPDLIRRWNLVGIPIYQGYGATETSPIVTATTNEKHDPRTVGRAVPGVEIKLAADGEVEVRGPNVTPGYWRNPEATRDALEDGWYHTGDLGEIDARGYLFLRGRKKNLIVLANGQNVFPEDVELALYATKKVTDAVVIGLPRDGGAQVHAVLLVPPGVDPSAVVREANDQLAAHQHIQGYTVWPEADFPRTHTLKVKRQEVMKEVSELQAGSKHGVSLEAHEPAVPATPVRRLIANATGLPADHLTAEMTLGDDAGLDSLGMVELLAAIEGELGIYLDESRVSTSTTVAQLETMLQEQEGSARPAYPSWPLWWITGLARRAIQRPIFALLEYYAPITVTGGEIIAHLHPPVLLVANHNSHLDTPTLLRALPGRLRRKVTVAAAADYFFAKPVLGNFVALLLNAFPFSRTTAIRATLEHCAGLLDRGWSILLYPEGTRSLTGEIDTFKSGVGLLAVELDVLVVPVRMVGLHQVLPKGRSRPRRGHVQVLIGEPLRFPHGTPYPEATAAIEAAVRGLGDQRVPAGAPQ